jgi:hypothetical protein
MRYNFVMKVENTIKQGLIKIWHSIAMVKLSKSMK